MNTGKADTTVCLGWHWQPYRHTRIAGDVNGHHVLPFPHWLGDIGRAVIGTADGPWYRSASATLVATEQIVANAHLLAVGLTA